MKILNETEGEALLTLLKENTKSLKIEEEDYIVLRYDRLLVSLNSVVLITANPLYISYNMVEIGLIGSCPNTQLIIQLLRERFLQIKTEHELLRIAGFNELLDKFINKEGK